MTSCLLVHNGRSPKAVGGHMLIAAAIERLGAEVAVLHISDLSATVADHRFVVRGPSGRGLTPDVICNRVSPTNFRPGLLRSLGLLGVPSVNDVSLDLHKWTVAVRLCAAGLPIPMQALLREGERLPGDGPVVLKPCTGTQGFAVALAAGGDILENAFGGPDGEFLVQEYLPEIVHGDLRVVVAGGSPVAALRRKSTSEDFRTNLALGGEASAHELTDEQAHIAVECAAVLGLEIAGVDLVLSERGPLVLEVNSNPEMGAAKFPIAGPVEDAIAEVVLSRVS